MKTHFSMLRAGLALLTLAATTGAQTPRSGPVITNTIRAVSPAAMQALPPAQRGAPAAVPAPAGTPAPAAPFLNDTDSLAPLPSAGSTTTTTVVAPARAGTNAPSQVVMGNVADTGESGVLSLVKPIDERVLEAGSIKFKDTPLDQVLEVYAQLTSRTVIRAPAVQPTTPITLITQTDLTTTEVIQAIDIVLAQNKFSIVPVGEKFLLVVPDAQALTEAAAFTDVTSDQLPEASQYITKILQLKNVKPSELVPAIQPFAKMPGGILPIDSTQVLIIRDYAVNLKRMLEIIEKVDVTVPTDQIFEVIPIKYALVSEVSQVLGSFTTGGPIAGSGTTSRGATSTASRSSFGSSANQQNRSTNPFNNNLNRGVFPQQAAPARPVPAPTPGTASSSFQQRLSQIVNAAAKGSAGTTPLLGDAKIIPFERNNALLVLASRQEMAMVKELVQKIDVVQPQVLIEAIIMEVSLNDNFEFGISAGQNRSTPGNNTLFGGFRNSFGGGNQAFGNAIATNLPSSLPGGFSYFAQLGSRWDIALQAIEGDGHINVLSRPRIQTSHAEQAELFVGDTRPYITGTSFGFNGQPISQYQQQSIGITLNVLPLINPEGLVVLEIQQRIENLGPDVIIDNNPVPTTTRREASAKVAVKHGETIILGGFISTQKTKTKSGVPGLRHIPMLGKLFSSERSDNRRVELVVLMRPTVLETPEVASLTAQAIKSGMPGIRMAERENEASEARRIQALEVQEMKLIENAPPPNKGKWEPPIDLFEVMESRP